MRYPSWEEIVNSKIPEEILVVNCVVKLSLCKEYKRTPLHEIYEKIVTQALKEIRDQNGNKNK
jgi:hypothetical protein